MESKLLLVGFTGRYRIRDFMEVGGSEMNSGLDELLRDPATYMLLGVVLAIYLYGEWYWRFGGGRYKQKPARKPRRRI